MDIYLKTAIVLLSVIVASLFMLYYATVRNVVDPIVDMMPKVIDNNSNNSMLAEDGWMTDRNHLEQSIIAKQGKFSIYIQWNMNCGIPNNQRFPHDMSRRLHIFYDQEPEWNKSTLDPVGTVIDGWGDLDLKERYDVILRGGYVLLNPAIDSSSDAVTNIMHINNAVLTNRVNVLDVSGMPGNHITIISQFLDRHPDTKNFNIERFLKIDGDIFFVVRPADNPGPECM